MSAFEEDAFRGTRCIGMRSKGRIALCVRWRLNALVHSVVADMMRDMETRGSVLILLVSVPVE